MFESQTSEAPEDQSGPEATNGLVFDLRNGARYSDVVEPDEVERLVTSGQLEQILLVSEMFGGSDSPGNTVTAGQGATKAKEQIDNAVLEALEKCDDLAYDVVPDYGGTSSLVPQRITFTAGDTSHVIITWG